MVSLLDSINKKRFLKLKIIVVFVSTAILFSCSKEKSEEYQIVQNPISFNSVISEDILTRANGTTWENGDRIGIFAIKNRATLSDENVINDYSNLSFYTVGDGKFYSDDSMMYYPTDDWPVDFISYYPYKANLTNYEYPIDIEEQTDLLYSHNLKSAIDDNTPKTLLFQRVLAKVVFNVTAKKSSVNLDKLQATLIGANSKAVFSLVDGVLSVDNSSKKNVSLEVKGDSSTDRTIESILLPTSQANVLEIEFKDNDSTYRWRIPHALEKGKVYTYNIALGDDSVTITRPKDYMEIPYYTNSESAPHSYKVLHMVKDINWLNPSYERKLIRNYSILFDTENRIPYWIAYPMHPVYLKSGNRTNEWEYDPKIPRQYQPNLYRSYPDRVYARGHMLASADRNATAKINKTTFYYTNMVPQNSRMNGSNWAKLEERVRYWCKQSQYDTLYVVTGVILPESPEPIEYTADVDGNRCAVPKYMYKALLRQEKRTGKYYSIGFKMENKDTGVSYRNSAVSIEELERETGFTFFPNAPDISSIKKQKDMTHWN